MRGPGVVALAGLLLLSVAACRGGHDPSPGEVLDDDEVTLAGGTAARRIRYGSIDVTGEPSDVSGLIALPAGVPPPGGWPVVAYAHGTSGGGDDCAPSEDPSLAGVGGALEALASAGYVAVATDYEGLGTSGPHPYLNGTSEARSVVDSVRAARTLVPNTSTRWAVVGHSQGGHAALFTAELAPGMAPELALVGAVAMAPVSDIAALTAPGAPFGSSFAVLVLPGFLATNPDLDEDELLLTDAGKDAVDAIDDGCDIANASDPLLVTDSPALDAYRAAQVPAQVRAAVPVLVQQGDADPLVTPSTTQDLLRRACELGSVVELRTYAGVDHLEIVEAGEADALAFIAARFADQPPPSSC